MAKPLPLVLQRPEISTDADVREDLAHKIAGAPVSHAEAVLAAYDLLQVMQDRGTLDLLRGFIGAHEEITGRVAAALDQPETTRALRNLIALMQMLGSIDSKVFEGLRDSVTEAAARSQYVDGAPGLWSVVKRIDSRDSLRALGVVADLLQSFGQHMSKEPRSPQAGSPVDSAAHSSAGRAGATHSNGNSFPKGAVLGAAIGGIASLSVLFALKRR